MVVTDPLLTIEEAAAILRISRSKAYEMAGSGRLPGAVTVGERGVRISRPLLEQWIAARAAPGQ